MVVANQSRMQKVRTRANRYLKQFVPYEANGSWKDDHDAAMKCRDLEEWLYDGGRSFDAIWHMFELFQKDAYVMSFPDEMLQDAKMFFKSVIGDWLAMAEKGEAAIKEYKVRFATLAGSDEFEQKIATARSFLTHFQDFPQAKAPAMQVWEATDEEVGELQAIVNGPKPVKDRVAKKSQSGDWKLIK